MSASSKQKKRGVIFHIVTISNHIGSIYIYIYIERERERERYIERLDEI